MQRVLSSVVAALSALILVIPSVAGAADPMVERLRPLSGDQFDMLFIEEMIGHHQMAIEMARPAQQRAMHPELRAMANNVVASQQAEIAEMTAWFRGWYGHDPMAMPMEGMDANMQMLGSAEGNEFDLMFIRMMIPHHQGAIDMSALAPDRAAHQELKDLARSIIAAQGEEIARMQQWQAAWQAGGQEMPMAQMPAVQMPMVK